MRIGIKLLSLFFVSSLHAQLRETRDIIALVDTGYSSNTNLKRFYCNIPSFDVTGTSINDINGHGTAMAYLISKYIDYHKTCIVSIKWYNDDKTLIKSTYNKVSTDFMKIVLALHPKYVNMSLSGTLFIKQEFKAIQSLIKQSIYVMVASGNNSLDLSETCKVYPACYPIRNKYFRVVGSQRAGKIASQSNYGGPVNSAEDGENQEYTSNRYVSGTSASTAMYTGELASGKIDTP